MSFYTIFEEVFQKNGLNEYITDENMQKFEVLTEIMNRTNQVMNITAITTVEAIISLHYADCVKVSRMIPQNAKVLDVGCGGGFPTLPLAIVRPDLQIIGLDSTEKKVKYVETVANTLSLPVKTISARAEDLAKAELYRECYDVVISRAVARLNVLSELCLPFVKVKGSFIAMKGAAGQDEYVEAKNAIQILGGALSEFSEYELKTLDNSETRTLFHIQKTKRTPEQYPRVFGTIKKRPL